MAPPVAQPPSPPGTAQGMPNQPPRTPLKVDTVAAASSSQDGVFFYERIDKNDSSKTYNGRSGVSMGAVGLAAAGPTGYVNVLGTDSNAYQAAADAEGFNGFSQAPGNGVGGVAATLITNANPVHVRYAVRGPDDKLYARNSNSSSYYSLGGVLTATPAVAHAANDATYYFARGTDNKLYVRTDATNFTSVNGSCVSGPGAATHGSTLVIACEAADQHLYSATLTLPFDGTNPAPATFHNLGGTIHAAPTVYYPSGKSAPDYEVKGDTGSNGNIFKLTPAASFAGVGRSCQGPPAVADTTDYQYFMCTSSGSPTPPPPSSVELWGVDSLDAITSKLYAQVSGANGFGHPQFWGRYIDRASSLGADEVQRARDNNTKILLIGRGEGTENQNTCALGTQDANDAIQHAEALGAPHGRAIFQDVEPNNSNISTSFIKCFYDTMHSDGRYEPGFYANPMAGDFGQDYCAAAQSDSKYRNIYFDSAQPQYTHPIANPGPKPYAPRTVPCSQTPRAVAWQYYIPGSDGGSVPADEDEFKGVSSLLW